MRGGNVRVGFGRLDALLRAGLEAAYEPLRSPKIDGGSGGAGPSSVLKYTPFCFRCAYLLSICALPSSISESPHRNLSI